MSKSHLQLVEGDPCKEKVISPFSDENVFHKSNTSFKASQGFYKPSCFGPPFRWVWVKIHQSQDHNPCRPGYEGCGSVIQFHILVYLKYRKKYHSQFIKDTYNKKLAMNWFRG